MADEAKPGGQGGNGQIIIIKKKNRAHHAHHGGAWKVAYADFVTAMMAFFLLLWLLSATTEEQKVGIAHYFNPPNNSTDQGGGTGIMGGMSVVATEQSAPVEAPVVAPQETSNSDDLAVQAKEDALFRQVAEKLKKEVMNVPELKALMENLLVDITPEGLRITITDAQGRELFENGSAKMFPHTEKMVAVVAGVVSQMSNQLAVGGHTDVVPYRGENPSYTNWELSADRAQAARKVLQSEGVGERRISRVSGHGSREPLLVDQPENIRNRRITFIVLRSKKGAVAQFSQDGLIAPEAGKPMPLIDTLPSPMPGSN